MLSKKVGGEHVCVKKGDYAEILVPCDSRISMEMEKSAALPGKYWLAYCMLYILAEPQFSWEMAKN